MTITRNKNEKKKTYTYIHTHTYTLVKMSEDVLMKLQFQAAGVKGKFITRIRRYKLYLKVLVISQ